MWNRILLLPQGGIKKASEPDYQHAQYRLALLNVGGKGVDKNEESGLELMRKAAEHGHEPAIAFLKDREN